MQEQLFNEYIGCKHGIQMLASIVQNTGFKPTDEQLKEHFELTARLCKELNLLNEKVKEYYLTKK